MEEKVTETELYTYALQNYIDRQVSAWAQLANADNRTASPAELESLRIGLIKLGKQGVEDAQDVPLQTKAVCRELFKVVNHNLGNPDDLEQFISGKNCVIAPNWLSQLPNALKVINAYEAAKSCVHLKKKLPLPGQPFFRQRGRFSCSTVGSSRVCTLCSCFCRVFTV